MFSSIGLFEVLIILVIALVVLGPDKLFVAVRTSGLLLRKIKILYSKSVDEFDRQVRLDEILREDKSLRSKKPREQIEEQTGEQSKNQNNKKQALTKKISKINKR